MQIDTVLVKVASRCNLNCSYCYVYNMGDDGWQDMPALISRSTISALAFSLGQLIKDQEKPFATVLHGGEPLMLGEHRLRYLLQSLRCVLPQSHVICIQTNGVLLTKGILDLCAEYRVPISISLDGPKVVNDRFRVKKKGGGSHDEVIAGIKLLREHSESKFLYAGLLSVIDPTSNPVANYEYFKSLGASSIDFLYRDGNHTNLPFGKNTAETTEYGEWMVKLLDAYIADPNPPKIRFFDDLVKLRLGGSGVKEGLGVVDYGIVIVEADGSIAKNDTLKSSFNGADRFDAKWSVGSSRFSEIINSKEFLTYHKLQKPTSQICTSCKYFKVCGGGMPLHRWRSNNNYDNPSVYCADQKVIIDRVEFHLRNEGLLK